MSNKIIAPIVCAFIYANVVRAQVSDPFAFDHTDQVTVIAQLDEQVKTLEAKALFISRLKELDSFEVALLDPASIDPDAGPVSSVKIEDIEIINQLKLALCEVAAKPQEAPFCFYPNYRVTGLKSGVPLCSLTISFGCGVYKVACGESVFTDGYSECKSLLGLLDKVLPMLPEHRDATKVATENARRLAEKAQLSPPTPR